MKTSEFVKGEDIKKDSNFINDTLREQVLEYAKTFKTSWINLGQHLYSIWRDKLYHSWGYEKFENYVEKEVGINKQQCMKILKTYLFVEQDEPAYLKKEFLESRDAVKVPGYEAINVLRMAKGKKELLRDDYLEIKKSVFDKGKDASVVRKDLTALMKERKIVDPEEERDKRNEASIKKVISALSVFKKDMESLQLLPDSIIVDASKLIDTLLREVSQ